jgi:predicted lipoprotein with Yx(FWY)xxD motif
MRRYTILLLAGLAGFSLALVAGIAGASSFTLEIAKNAKVTNQAGTTKQEAIAVTQRGRAVYELTGDRPSHPECTSTNHCFMFWPPVKVKSGNGLTKAPGIKGKLGVWRRDGFVQLTLNGHPLYRYSGDSKSARANGQGIKTFGGTWHVVSTGPASSGSGGMTTTGTTTTGTSGTTTTTCAYPPYC